MKMHMIRTFFAVGLAGGVFNALAVAQTTNTIEAHVAAANAAAGDHHRSIRASGFKPTSPPRNASATSSPNLAPTY